ncbi:MAG: ATP-binding protein [Deltaproteobacteria bacterium]|nr:ATP-binding protein [Deltaproteobacteria bacterium]
MVANEMALVVEELLYKGEGANLDYKSQQYKFSSGSNEEKSEIVKDILAMANAWGKGDRHILIGVKEQPGEAELLGIQASDHIDDAHLQQLVNGKTNRPVHFQYASVDVKGKSIGLITIEEQSRPIFLKKGFGKCEKNVVYVRRGSSTTTADPSEIAQMGAAVTQSPDLAVLFVVEQDGQSSAAPEIKSQLLEQESADALRACGEPEGVGPFHMAIRSPMQNANYGEELEDFYRFHGLMREVFVVCENSGSEAARHVVVELEFDLSVNSFSIAEEQAAPEMPEETTIGRIAKFESATAPRDVHVLKSGKRAIVRCDFGLLRSGEKRITETPFYLGAKQPVTVDAQVSTMAENMKRSDVAVRFKFDCSSYKVDLSD